MNFETKKIFQSIIRFHKKSVSLSSEFPLETFSLETNPNKKKLSFLEIFSLFFFNICIFSFFTVD